MIELFPDNPEAISNTIEIAEKCNLNLALKKITCRTFLFLLMQRKTLDELLERLVYDGLKIVIKIFLMK